MNRISRKAAFAAATAALVAPVGMQSATAASQAAESDHASTQHSSVAAKVSAATVIKRAKTWLTAGPNGGPVPYSQSAKKGGYRTDCSGYVSMTLGLPKGEWGGPNTQALAGSTYTKHMKSMKNLKKGDLVIDAAGSNTTRHVVIFEKWANSAKTKYWAYDQNGTDGTAHKVRSYGIGSDDYDPYRPKAIG